MRSVLLTIIGIVGLAAPALSAEPTQCFDIASTAASLIAAIKINKCTGETWVMRMVAVGNGGTSIRWFPVKEDTREPVLVHGDVIGK